MTNEVLTKVIIDASLPEGHPDKVKILPLTPEELAQREADRIAAEAAEAERLQAEADLQALKDSARQKLIAGEPLTEAEAGVLVI